MILVDTYDKNVTDGFRILGGDQRKARSNLFRSADVGEIQVRTDEAYVDPIIRFFRSRERR